MAVVPFTDARNRLSELIDEATPTHERIEITKHGRGAHLCRRSRGFGGDSGGPVQR
ncbi:type II toxin-antitoxin system Phd/YefM family antitoxin [Micromonospora matsumotoense]|uniref:type II toxin-antitoxin system Phd/YefM family antitoxin n=1 Tax=Micromonospora matsumotoense TaxID=121616 RepID=UPI0033ED342E